MSYKLLSGRPGLRNIKQTVFYTPTPQWGDPNPVKEVHAQQREKYAIRLQSHVHGDDDTYGASNSESENAITILIR